MTKCLKNYKKKTLNRYLKKRITNFNNVCSLNSILFIYELVIPLISIKQAER